MSYRKIILGRDGHFGEFGGRYVPELLVPIMDDLSYAFFNAIEDDEFRILLDRSNSNFIGRPSPLVYLENLSNKLGGARLYLKNEGVNHTGAHKINHCLGQGLLAKRMNKSRVIAETGAGQHGLATAAVCARLGLECTVYMGALDYERQRPNVFWMEKLGAKVVPVNEGGKILRDAINAALRDLISNPFDTHYLLGTVCGPHPYPVMNTYFQKIVGEELRKQIKLQAGKLPNTLIACVGGGSNAMGLFYDFLDDTEIELIAVEAGGKGISSGHHAARFKGGRVGVAEGFKSIFLQDDDGQLAETHSISAGLDYSGVGPQFAYLQKEGRVKFTYATDEAVISAYNMLAKSEGILAALESCHAVSKAIELAKEKSEDEVIVINGSGRSDKDLFILAKNAGDKEFNAFLKNEADSY